MDMRFGKWNIRSLYRAGLLMTVSKEMPEYKLALLFHHQNAGQNHDINIAKRLFGNVAQFKYFGTTVRNQNLIQEEIKRKLNSGDACCHSVQNLPSSCLLLKNKKIRI
jgi:hypothetical protein